MAMPPCCSVSGLNVIGPAGAGAAAAGGATACDCTGAGGCGVGVGAAASGTADGGGGVAVGGGGGGSGVAVGGGARGGGGGGGRARPRSVTVASGSLPLATIFTPSPELDDGVESPPQATSSVASAVTGRTKRKKRGVGMRVPCIPPGTPPSLARLRYDLSLSVTIEE